MHRSVARIVPLLLSTVGLFNGLHGAADEPVDAATGRPSNGGRQGHLGLEGRPENPSFSAVVSRRPRLTPSLPPQSPMTARSPSAGGMWLPSR